MSTVPTVILFDQQFDTPEENLAVEEALLDSLDAAEASAAAIRFWESPRPFVVLGYSKRVEQDVYTDRCAAADVPVLRRCSGGGTVLQGPGCLNYALFLPVSARAELATITGTNRWIMEQNRLCFERLTGQPVQVQGHTDLTIGPQKFSGNAQRRKRLYILFHGAILLRFDLGLVERLLRPPEQQPEYRAQRTHTDFLMNLQLDGERVRSALLELWSEIADEPVIAATDGLVQEVQARSAALVAEKYSTREWNLKF